MISKLSLISRAPNETMLSIDALRIKKCQAIFAMDWQRVYSHDVRLLATNSIHKQKTKKPTSWH